MVSAPTDNFAPPTVADPGTDRTVPTPAFELDEESAAAVDLARAAVAEVAAGEAATTDSGLVGEHLGVRAEGERLVTHAFAATLRGYRGWYWAVTLARAPGFPPTVAEIVLLPGDGALLAPAWVPWSQRLLPGDLSPGDVVPTALDDPRLVPGYVFSDDPQVEEVAFELGLGRVRVLSRWGRQIAAERWAAGDGGPDTPMARQAPAPCGTCGFFIPLAGSLRGGFGACANELSSSDGRIVTVDHGCGAHSEVVVEVHVEELGEVYEDDAIDPLVISDEETVRAEESAEAEEPLEVEHSVEPATKDLQ
jgi:Protein of unknown function (DUF3027)